jgi:hypothetical protein
VSRRQFPLLQSRFLQEPLPWNSEAKAPQPSASLVASFDGLGVGFEGPQGTANLRNPSDNSLAVGKDHIFQIVNTRMAIFTKKGKQYKNTGTVLYGPAPTNSLFKRFGGVCEATNNGDCSGPVRSARRPLVGCDADLSTRD